MDALFHGGILSIPDYATRSLAWNAMKIVVLYFSEEYQIAYY